MRIWLIGTALFLLACDAFLRLNPNYCDDSVQCGAGTSCDLAQRRCVEAIGGPLLLSEVAPAAASRRGGAQVTLTGQGFVPGAEVHFADSVSPEVSFVSDTELRVTVPAGTCGPAKVSVHNPDGEQAVRADLFAYNVQQLEFAVGIPLMLDPDAEWAVEGRFSKEPVSDLLLGFSNSPSLQILTNDNMSGWITHASFASDSFVTGVVRDLDVNGTPEIIARSLGGIEVWKPFDNISLYRINEDTRDMAIVDANLDGKLDIVALSDSGDELLTYQQSGPLSFGLKIAIGLPFIGKSLYVADFNHDGRQDIAIASAMTNEVYLCLASPAGTTSCNMVSLSVPGAPEHLGAADLGGEAGVALLVITASSGTGTVRTFDARSTPITELFQMPINKTPTQVLLEDIDCDGLRDVITYGVLGSPIEIYINQRNGRFAMTPARIPLAAESGLRSIDLAIAKMRADDPLLDILAVANYGVLSPALLRRFKNASM